jgi:glycosyltransferase involved in cell wall biosynthesis
MPRVLIVRGRLATPWELRPWSQLPRRFDVSYLLTPSNEFDATAIDLHPERVTTLGDRLPGRRLGRLAAAALGDRYLSDADAAYAAADVVHAEELSFWFAADAARRKARHGYKLVLTVWETLPFLRAYRNRHVRRYRDEVLAATDLFLAATQRARLALLLEGVPEDRIVVCQPGIDLDRFGARAPAPKEHVILSPGRLVWEKGHQDVIRAVALLARRGVRPRLRITGRGPEEGRLRRHAAELRVGDQVEIGAVPYDRMPGAFASSSCMVLPASHRPPRSCTPLTCRARSGRSSSAWCWPRGWQRAWTSWPPTAGPFPRCLTGREPSLHRGTGLASPTCSRPVR